MPTTNSFGRLLQGEISRREWSQLDLAHTAGVSNETVRRYVTGESVPRRLEFDLIAVALGWDAGMRAMAWGLTAPVRSTA